MSMTQSRSHLRTSGTFEVRVPRDRILAHLTNPRNLITANHTGAVIDRSEGMLRAGSWFLLSFDQLTARVEYTTFDPPGHVSATVAMSGVGAGGSSHHQDFVLTELDQGRTRVEVTVNGTGGLIRWTPLMRSMQAIALRRLRRKIEASA